MLYSWVKVHVISSVVLLMVKLNFYHIPNISQLNAKRGLIVKALVSRRCTEVNCGLLRGCRLWIWTFHSTFLYNTLQAEDGFVPFQFVQKFIFQDQLTWQSYDHHVYTPPPTTLFTKLILHFKLIVWEMVKTCLLDPLWKNISMTNQEISLERLKKKKKKSWAMYKVFKCWLEY